MPKCLSHETHMIIFKHKRFSLCHVKYTLVFAYNIFENTYKETI